jgi:hypothetical protein
VHRGRRAPAARRGCGRAGVACRRAGDRRVQPLPLRRHDRRRPDRLAVPAARAPC